MGTEQIRTQANASRHPVLLLLEDLIRIESVNPHFDANAQGEAKVADYLEERLTRAGLAVRRQRVFEGRDNLIAELRVGRPEGALLFESHMDTVPLGSMDNALEPIYRDGRLYGRGACDTKSSLASMVHAMEYWAANRDRLPRDLVLCAVVDEEAAYRGVLRWLEEPVAVAGAVVGEPTGLRIVTATKGCARFAIRTKGKAAHSSVPHEGDNAIYQMMDILTFIRNHAEPELSGLSHPLCGRPTISVGTIESGGQINIVPESCEIQVDRRIIPGERPDEVRGRLVADLERSLDLTRVRFECRELLSDWALDTSPDAEVVRHAQEAAVLLGINPEVIGVPYGTDASKLQQLGGIPSIVFGPGSIAQAHSREEWVEAMDVIRAAEFYIALAGIS
ncbi:M20 family metallopeptidase [Paenibacillus sp. LHD-117]|uniref:M20 family metallopeptidase n=1 Tax=Paenibacillus sp. LHD-117 TaxID=3071412 RepID=UPI0027DFE179|nr:M20 family metallopeptidase [Paenibacillus sp. LHD-117]MDQ6419719.1 M20 family metallopeptidase [Paenibacillus sp. LHD-117]